MSEQADQLRRRKNELRRKAASFGYSTPPEVSTELQDIDNVLHLIELVNICRQRLAILVRQSEQFGTAWVPPHIENEIDSTRQTISVHYVSSAAPENIDVWRERIERKIDQILTLLQERSS